MNSSCPDNRSIRPCVLFSVAAVFAFSLLLLARPLPLLAQDADADAPSASPSDIPPPADAAPDAAKAAAPSSGKSACCSPTRRRCRPRRIGRRRCRRVCVSSGSAAAEPQWTNLFDGKALGKWESIKFGGEGEVAVKDGMIVMPMGASMTGVAYKGELPRTNYELELEGQRLDGIDFFATTTFPVGKDYCSFVTGGWGGTVIGLSCIDFYDAADNSTSAFFDFKDKTWYRFRIRVTDAKIEAWVNDERVVNQLRKGHKIGIRDECDLCKPLGIATWDTSGAVRNMRVRDLTPDEVKAAAAAAKEEEF